MRAYGVPQTFLSGQPYFDEVLTNYHRSAMPDEPLYRTRLEFKDDPRCEYCEKVCLGDVCRNCGARRKG